jgi:hypothetical protein
MDDPGSMLRRGNSILQTEIYNAELLVPDPSSVEVEAGTTHLKWYTSPGSDHIPSDLIQPGGETLLSAKNCVFWDVTPCGSCKNRRFGGT